jgi:hypothetical protein
LFAIWRREDELLIRDCRRLLSLDSSKDSGWILVDGSKIHVVVDDDGSILLFMIWRGGLPFRIRFAQA